jgi:hypothetical protein
LWYVSGLCQQIEIQFVHLNPRTKSSAKRLKASESSADSVLKFLENVDGNWQVKMKRSQIILLVSVLLQRFYARNRGNYQIFSIIHLKTWSLVQCMSSEWGIGITSVGVDFLTWAKSIRWIASVCLECNWISESLFVRFFELYHQHQHLLYALPFSVTPHILVGNLQVG